MALPRAYPGASQPKNPKFASAFHTEEVNFTSTDTWESMIWSDNKTLEGISHIEGKAEFTVDETRRYTYMVNFGVESSSLNKVIGIRALFDGVVVPGSIVGSRDVTHKDKSIPLGSVWVFDGVKGKDFVIQFSVSSLDVKLTNVTSPGPVVTLVVATIIIQE